MQAASEVLEKMSATGARTTIYSGSRVWWNAPPLSTNTKFGDISVRELMRQVYGTNDLDVDAVIDDWDRAASFARANTKQDTATFLKRSFSSRFPFYSFSSPNLDPNPFAFVQYLALCGLSVGGDSFVCTENDASFTYKKRVIGVNHRNITMSSGPWRYITQNPRPLTDALSWSPKVEVRSSHKTDAVLRHMITHCPHQARELKDIFCLAVIAGKDCEEALTEKFTVIADPLDDSHWSKARQLISNAEDTTIQNLADVLIPVIGNRTFRRVFGNPRAAPSTYTSVQQTRHLKALTDLETGVIAEKIPLDNEEVEDTTEALRLVEFQNLLGRL